MNKSTSKQLDILTFISLALCRHTKNLILILEAQVASVKAEVHGIVAGIPVPFPLPNSDACKNSGLTCPMPANQKQTYQNELPVKSEYPSVSITT